jgi:hypothetical protein
MSKLLLLLKKKRTKSNNINQEIEYIQEKGTFIYNIKPFCFYFPQFHSIPENDINFYPGMTDITSLNQLINLTKEELETPSTTLLPLKNMLDYDLVNNKELIQRQIDIISDYNIGGFAIYYYWFSENSITNKNMIFEKVINQFFDSNLNMKGRKVFLVWANTPWNNNKFFGNSNSINNTYETQFLINNANNLINYFKHDNYLKIDNKPVFFIYHNHLIENIDLFFNILDNVCIKHNFNGVHFVLNSFVDMSKKYPNFYINFNYKRNDARFYDENKKQIKLNYKEYIDNDYHLKHDCIQTISTHFNNKPRLFRPNKLMHSIAF